MARHTAFRALLQQEGEWIRDATADEVREGRWHFWTRNHGTIWLQPADAAHPPPAPIAMEVQSGTDRPGWCFGQADTVVLESLPYGMGKEGAVAVDYVLLERRLLAEFFFAFRFYAQVDTFKAASCTPFAVWRRRDGSQHVFVGIETLCNFSATHWTGIPTTAAAAPTKAKTGAAKRKKQPQQQPQQPHQPQQVRRSTRRRRQRGAGGASTSIAAS